MRTKNETAHQRRARRTRYKLKQVNRDGLPRVSVHRTNKQIYAQIIDDTKGVTVASASTLDKELKVKNGGTIDAAKKVGELLAKRATDAKLGAVQFDRGGYLYHGRVKALAEAARESGMKF